MWVASLLAIGAIAVLRLAWSRPRRSLRLNGIGWGLMLLAAVVGWSAAGAWGTTVAALAGMGGAMLLLGHSAMTSNGRQVRASNRRAGMLPERGEPVRLGRRITTFLIVTFLALAASVGIALGAYSVAQSMGAGEADAIALGFFTTPLAWSLLAFYLLMEARRTRQIAVLALAAMAGLPAFLTGVAQ